jgi:hypothetical protein
MVRVLTGMQGGGEGPQTAGKGGAPHRAGFMVSFCFFSLPGREEKERRDEGPSLMGVGDVS